MKALAVFAHPDDETMLCGGALALLAKEGWKVHYGCATRGEVDEAGEAPDDAVTQSLAGYRKA